MNRSVIWGLIGISVVSVGNAFAGDRPKVMPNAKEVFAEAAELIRENYVDGAPSDDELWTNAVAGVLDRMIQTKGARVNALLDPNELRELTEGIKGTVSGVGIVIRKFDDVVLVKEVIAGGPAAERGIQAGDRILAIDGASVRGLEQAELLSRIRGAEGTTIDLLMQREQSEWVQPLTRKSLQVPSVTGRMLEGGLLYVKIAAFHKGAAEQIDKLVAANQKGLAGIVLDLRDCPGGMFDEALTVAERFLPPGKRIVSLRGRGGKPEHHDARAKNAGDVPPMTVLVDRATASSAEIVAGSLQTNGRARLIGEKTLGKGTVERIVQLKNGWAMRISVARFYSPAGVSWQDKGIEPDFAIASAPAGEDGPVPLDGDPAIKAARAVLAMERGGVR